MPDTETPNDNRETLSYMSDLLDKSYIKIDRMAHQLDMQQKQLDHLDEMLHEVHQFIEEHKPALGRALGFLDPGRSMRDYLKHRPKARSDGQP